MWEFIIAVNNHNNGYLLSTLSSKELKGAVQAGHIDKSSNYRLKTSEYKNDNYTNYYMVILAGSVSSALQE